jgi:hypothetical protein
VEAVVESDLSNLYFCYWGVIFGGKRENFWEKILGVNFCGFFSELFNK